MRSIDDAIIQVESVGDDNAHGDLHLTQQAYGPMQIRQPVCIDVNKAFGTSFDAQYFLGRRALSRACFWLYMSLYATSRQLGRQVTDEDRARIWNGGPAGWRSPYTLDYWQKVKKAMEQ